MSARRDKAERREFRARHADNDDAVVAVRAEVLSERLSALLDEQGDVDRLPGRTVRAEDMPDAVAARRLLARDVARSEAPPPTLPVPTPTVDLPVAAPVVPTADAPYRSLAGAPASVTAPTMPAHRRRHLAAPPLRSFTGAPASVTAPTMPAAVTVPPPAPPAPPPPSAEYYPTAAELAAAPPRLARPPSVEDRAAAAAAVITDGSLGGADDLAWARGAAAYAARLRAAVDHAATVEAAAPSGEVGAARSAVRTMAEHAVAVDRLADLAGLPPDVRAGIGTSATTAEIYHAARAEWHAARPGLPDEVREAIVAHNPMPALPPAPPPEQAAAEPVATGGVVPGELVGVRPPAGWLDYPGEVDADAIEADGLDAAEDTAAAISGFAQWCARLRSGRYADLYYGAWRLPGNGAPDEDKCGKFRRLKGCRHEDHKAMGVPQDAAKAVPYYCYRIDCPECFEAAIRRMAGRIVERCHGYLGLRRSDLYDKAARKRLPLHCTLSVPKELYGQLETPEGLKEVNGFVRKRLEAMGIEASFIFFHPFRFDKKAQGRPYYNPHFHLVAFGWVDYGEVKRQFEKDGWIFKKIRVMRSLEHVRSCVHYILSHVGVADGVDAYRLFGRVAYNKFGANSVLAAQHDLPNALVRIVSSRSKGEGGLLPDWLVMGAKPPPAAEGTCWRISARVYDHPDHVRTVESDEGTREYTETRLDDCVERTAARIDGFEVRSRADFDRLVERLGREGHIDNPAFPPITLRDVGEGGEVSEEAQARATARGHRLPPQSVVVLRVERVNAAVEGADGPAAGHAVKGYNPTKHAVRYLTICLRPDLNDLCMICRRPLQLLDVDQAADGPLRVDVLPLDQQVLVPHSKLAELDKSGPSIKLYSEKDGKVGYDFHLVGMPEHWNRYPPHIQTAIKAKARRATAAYELYMTTGRRPSREVVDNAIAAEDDRERAAAGCLTVDNRPTVAPTADGRRPRRATAAAAEGMSGLYA